MSTYWKYSGCVKPVGSPVYRYWNKYLNPLSFRDLYTILTMNLPAINMYLYRIDRKADSSFYKFIFVHILHSLLHILSVYYIFYQHILLYTIDNYKLCKRLHVHSINLSQWQAKVTASSRLNLPQCKVNITLMSNFPVSIFDRKWAFVFPCTLTYVI